MIRKIEVKYKCLPENFDEILEDAFKNFVKSLGYEWDGDNYKYENHERTVKFKKIGYKQISELEEDTFT